MSRYKTEAEYLEYQKRISKQHIDTAYEELVESILELANNPNKENCQEAINEAFILYMMGSSSWSNKWISENRPDRVTGLFEDYKYLKGKIEKEIKRKIVSSIDIPTTERKDGKTH